MYQFSLYKYRGCSLQNIKHLISVQFSQNIEFFFSLNVLENQVLIEGPYQIFRGKPLTPSILLLPKPFNFVIYLVLLEDFDHRTYKI